MSGGGGDGDGNLPSVDHVPLCNEGAVVKMYIGNVDPIELSENFTDFINLVYFSLLSHNLKLS
jgi:hypothetical protein